MVVDGTQVKIQARYDNEIGYLHSRPSLAQWSRTPCPRSSCRKPETFTHGPDLRSRSSSERRAFSAWGRAMIRGGLLGMQDTKSLDSYTRLRPLFRKRARCSILDSQPFPSACWRASRLAPVRPIPPEPIPESCPWPRLSTISRHTSLTKRARCVAAMHPKVPVAAWT